MHTVALRKWSTYFPTLVQYCPLLSSIAYKCRTVPSILLIYPVCPDYPRLPSMHAIYLVCPEDTIYRLSC